STTPSKSGTQYDSPWAACRPIWRLPASKSWDAGEELMRVRLLYAVVVVITVVTDAAWADHGGSLRTGGWSPMAAALLFGGLALLAGMLVVVIIALLTRRARTPPRPALVLTPGVLAGAPL